ncbi:MAG TPA: hypothetical protein VLF66_14080 [Thermoanaerobaculia bacterium]|nr:hypothetical protein [Thermoanaerobaculia bacterium]
MHITAEMILAVERGEMSKEELIDIMIEHLAQICPGSAEIVAAHEARLARGEDPNESRRILEWELCLYSLMSKWSACNHDHGPC